MTNWVDPSDVPARLAAALTSIKASLKFVPLSNAGGIIYTVPQILAGLIDRSGAAAVSDTTPGAAELVTALAGLQPGDGHMFYIRNRNSGQLTLLGGHSVVVSPGVPSGNKVEAGSTRGYLVTVDSTTPGAEQVSFNAVTNSKI